MILSLRFWYAKVDTISRSITILLLLMTFFDNNNSNKYNNNNDDDKRYHEWLNRTVYLRLDRSMHRERAREGRAHSWETNVRGNRWKFIDYYYYFLYFLFFLFSEGCYFSIRSRIDESPVGAATKFLEDCWDGTRARAGSFYPSTFLSSREIAAAARAKPSVSHFVSALGFVPFFSLLVVFFISLFRLIRKGRATSLFEKETRASSE